MNIFELKGPKGNFRGAGNPDGKPAASQNFPLRQGVLVIRIEYHGSGEFELKFDATEEFSEGQATTTGIGRGAITGAFVGGLAGAIVGIAAGALARKLFGRESWTTETLTGEFEDFWIIRVAEDGEADLKPGEYRIEVVSSAQGI